LALATFWQKLAIGIVLFFLFRYAGEFSSTQSLALVVLVWVGYEFYTEFRNVRQVEKDFSPFLVQVEPNWKELLRDHRLIDSDEEFDAIFEKMEQNPTLSDVLKNGFTFTILKPGEPGLVFWNNRRTFHGKVDFEEEIEEIKLETPRVEALLWSPRVYVRGSAGSGCEIGLDVHSKWWENICTTSAELAGIRADEDFTTGRTRVELAWFPSSEFRVYDPGNVPRSGSKWEREQVEIREAQQLAPWKKHEFSPEDLKLGASLLFEHKYFWVSHRAI
jgi:hypothetical protein